MKYITKIKLRNFKKFTSIEIPFKEDLNLFIGDNEAGKSTILSAIDVVLSGSRNKVETIGVESLFNRKVIDTFLSGSKKYEDLPILYAELYLNDQDNEQLDGQYNSTGISSHGMMLELLPNNELVTEIKEILAQAEANFPFEYYLIHFKTFAGESYTGYRRFMNHLLIDNSQISNEYATNSYIKSLYNQNVKSTEKIKHQNEYRKHKQDFKDRVLIDLNNRVTAEYGFSLKTNKKSNLDVDLTIQEGNIDITQKGKGRQCFVKTDFALAGAEFDLDIVLLEEPENNLSHLNMRRLVKRIGESSNKQLFIATHNDLVSTRLGLKSAKLLNSSSDIVSSLEDLSKETASFFMKAPDNNILEFVLSQKVVFVEGDAEFILVERFYIDTFDKLPSEDGIHFISVGGTSFKRYLEISNLLKIKTVIIRDNDGDYENNCVDRYKDFVSDDIAIFSETDNDVTTFEVSMYNANVDLCEQIFSSDGRVLPIQDYMLKNKADAAFELLSTNEKVVVPDYIIEAFKWIRE